MEKLNELRLIAQGANCADIVSDLEQRSEALKAQNEIQLAALGECGSGKTSFLNRIVGQTLREPSAVPTEGLPMRIVFNRQQPRDGFDHVEVFAPKWDDSGVALHEFSFDDISDKDMTDLSAKMDLIDVVVYTVSAAMPLTETDSRIIGMVAPRPVILVLTKTDLIPEEERENLVQFVQGFCNRNKIALMLVSSSDETQDMGKAVRDFLAGQDMTALREKQIAAWTDQAQAALCAQIEREIDNLTQSKIANERLQQEAEAKAHEVRLFWKELHTKVREHCVGVETDMREHFNSKNAKYVQYLQEQGKQAQYSSQWQNKLPGTIEQLMKEILDEYAPRLTRYLRRDLETIQLRAGARLNETITLPEDTIQGLTSVSIVIQPDQPKPLYAEERGRLYRDIGIGSAGAAAFAILLPHSMPLALAGAAVTVGTVYNHTREEKNHTEQQWEIILKKYWDKNYKNVEESLMAQIQEQYDRMLNFLDEKYEQELQANQAASAGIDTSTRFAELNELLIQARKAGNE